MGYMRIHRALIAVMIGVLAMVAVCVQDGHAASENKVSAKATTKATTKAAKSKTVAINIVVISETEAEADISVQKIDKNKTATLIRTVELKKGANYFTYNKGRNGQYKVSVNAFGDVLSQSVTTLQGKYTLLFQVAPPTDGDDKKTKGIVYQDLTKIKQKK